MQSRWYVRSVPLYMRVCVFVCVCFIYIYIYVCGTLKSGRLSCKSPSSRDLPPAMKLFCFTVHPWGPTVRCDLTFRWEINPQWMYIIQGYKLYPLVRTLRVKFWFRFPLFLFRGFFWITSSLSRDVHHHLSTPTLVSKDRSCILNIFTMLGHLHFLSVWVLFT
jgi:hypothetical protein